MPTIGRFNWMILGTGHPLFMWAGNRPRADICGVQLGDPKRSVAYLPGPRRWLRSSGHTHLGRAWGD